jgi:hypothetical protein
MRARLLPTIGSTLPPWLGETLLSVGVAARATALFGAAVAFGLLIAFKFADGSVWLAAAAAAFLLLFVILPLRVWRLLARNDFKPPVNGSTKRRLGRLP